jgi:hypothetical protein
MSDSSVAATSYVPGTWSACRTSTASAWSADQLLQAKGKRSISVVIPAHNEAATTGATAPESHDVNDAAHSAARHNAPRQTRRHPVVGRNICGYALGNAPDRPDCRRPLPGPGHLLDRQGKHARPDCILGALVVPIPLALTLLGLVIVITARRSSPAA